MEHLTLMDYFILIKIRFVIMTIAIIFDILFGEYVFLRYNIPHPIVWIGNYIAIVDNWVKTYLHQSYALFIAGCALVIPLGLLSLSIGYYIEYNLANSATLLFFGIYSIVSIGCVWIFVAIKSLYQHVVIIENDLRRDDLEGARKSLSMIVGRNTTTMNSSNIVRASLESLSESTNDAVIAPLFYYLMFGVGGIIFYKAMNTADSMIGHKKEHYYFFGKCVARIDDVLNFIPSRLSFVVLFMMYGWRQRKNVQNYNIVIMQIIRSWQNARRHVSLNAGYTEIGFAMLLNVQLGGIRYYGDKCVDGIVMNVSGKQELTHDDIRMGLKLYNHFLMMFFMIIMLFMFVLFIDKFV